MSNLDIKDIENILNNTSSNLFHDPELIKFKILEETEQIIVSPSIKALQINSRLTYRMLKKAKSKEIISQIRNAPATSHVKVLMDLLSYVVDYKIDWSKHINLEVNVKEEVIEKAKEVLKDHIEGVKEFLIDPISKLIKEIDVDKKELNQIWKDNILKRFDVVEKVDSFRAYSTMKESISYPYLILSCKTGSVYLTESSSVNFLKVEINKLELEKLKDTEKVLKEYSTYIGPFVETNKAIDIIKMLDSSSFSSIEDCYSESDYIRLYEEKFNRAISMHLLLGKISIDSKFYELSSVNLNEIKDIISATSKRISKEVEEHFEKESIKLKERYGKPYTKEILGLINEFSKKGITTYVSILIGDTGSKITSNGYNKSPSYGSMSEFSKVYITNTIRELIDDDIIYESTFKASFGRYTGLILSDEAKDFIENCATLKNSDNTKCREFKIDSFKMLLNELRGLSKPRASSLLIKTSESVLNFKKEDFNLLLEFIEKERSLYREYEEIFNRCISKIVPNIYKPLFLLNSNFLSGVNKKTLKTIHDMLED